MGFMRPRPLAALAAFGSLLVTAPSAAQDEGGYAAPPEPNQTAPEPRGGGNGEAGYTGSARTRGGGESGGDLLRPSTRPMWVAAGLGLDFHRINAGKAAPGFRKLPKRFALAFDFGYHFDGAGEGPAIGASLEQSFGDGFYTFNPNFKFWWDIMIADMAIYVAPFAKAGYLLGSTGQLAHGFVFGGGIEGRVILDDRWFTYLRPAQLDVVIGDFFGDTVHVNFFVYIGGGVTF
jgi:hypothetical protein